MLVEDRQPHCLGRIYATVSKNRFNLLPSESAEHSRRWRGGTRGGDSRLHLLSARSAEAGTLHLAVRAEPAEVIPSSFPRLLGGAKATGRTPGPPSCCHLGSGPGQAGDTLGWSGARRHPGSPRHPPSCQKSSQQQ